MEGKIIAGILLILLGLFLIIRPHKVAECIKVMYKYSQFHKSEKQLSTRKKFIILFGVIWILVGLFILFFGP